MKVSEVMSGDVFTLSPGQTLEEAARLLMKRGVSGVPVVENKKVIGMLSERDLLETRTIPHPPRYLELLGGIIYLDNPREFQRQLEKTVATKVEQVMTREVFTLDVDASLEEAARIILDHGVNRIPILENGRLAGIVTRSDILRGAVK